MTSAAHTRLDAIDEIAHDIPEQIWRLSRLFWRRQQPEISRTEAGLLDSLADGPRRITELADLEGIAQPTVTLLVGRLEQRGLVSRERDPVDGRAVRVTATLRGAEALDRLRTETRAMMREHIAAMSDDDVGPLIDATQALGALVDAVQRGSER